MTENRYLPDEVSPPGETLLESLEERGMTQSELGERTGRPKKTINEIVKGKAAITPETAIQLERVLGISAGFWLNRERQYRESIARNQERARLAGWADWVRNFPVGSMSKLGWIPPRRPSKGEVVEDLLRFFGVVAPSQWDDIWTSRLPVAYRKSKKSEPYALAAWLRQGQIEAQQLSCAPFDERRFRERLGWIRSLTAEPPELFQESLVRACADCGVAVVFVPELPGCGASGATYWATPAKAVLQLSLRYKKDDYLWFTFFHEAGHILLHGRRGFIVEGLDGVDGKEEQANRFAADFLIPPEALRGLVASRKTFSEAAIRAFAREQGISPGIVVGRLQHDGQLPPSHLNGLKRALKWADG